MAKAKLWSIGYAGHTPESFVAALQEAGVDTLVDVRQRPLSRKVGFSKTALGGLLQRAGITYLHMPLLGTPKDIRDEYHATRDVEAFRLAYNHHLDGAGLIEEDPEANPVVPRGRTRQGTPARRAKARHQGTPLQALTQLESLAIRRRVAMMCVEPEAEACHRWVLGERAVADGYAVEHLAPPVAEDEPRPGTASAPRAPPGEAKGSHGRAGTRTRATPRPPRRPSARLPSRSRAGRT